MIIWGRFATFGRRAPTGPEETVVLTSSTVGFSANAATGTSIRQCPQRYRDLTLIQIAQSQRLL